MKKRDLREMDLDSIWTPGAFSGRCGLQVDPTPSHNSRALSWTRPCYYARGRNRLFDVRECGDNILFLI
jgi:hypothetical protein